MPKVRKFIENIISLSFVESATLIFPIIYIPWVLDKLGLDSYGVVAWHQAVTLLLSVVIQFGFNIYGVKKYNEVVEENGDIKELFWSLFYTRVVIFCAVMFVAILIAPLVLEAERLKLFAIAAIYNFGDIFLLRWFLMSSGKLPLQALSSVSHRCFQLILMFALVSDSMGREGYLYAFSISYLIVSFITFIFVIKGIGICVPKKVIGRIGSVIREGFEYFLSRSVVSLIDKMPVMTLGLMVGDAAVGAYDLASKIVGAIQIPFGILCQSFFPLSFSLKGKNQLLYLILACLFIYMLMYAFVINFGTIFIWYFGQVIIPVIPIINFLILSIGINIISHNVGNSGLVACGMGVWFNRSIFFSATLYLILFSVLLYSDLVSIHSMVLIYLVYLGLIMLLRSYVYIGYVFQERHKLGNNV